MRFAAKHRNYHAGTARAEKSVLALDGQRDITVTSLPIQFEWGILTSDERHQAAQHFHGKHLGTTVDKDEITVEDTAFTRLSGFDTVAAQRQNGWTDEERELVEKKLQEGPHFGQDYILLEAVHAALPWASYDKTHWKRIPELALELGCVQEAISYEEQAKNRDSVLKPLREKLGAVVTEPVEDEPLVAA